MDPLSGPEAVAIICGPMSTVPTPSLPLDRWATPEVPRRFRDYLTPLRRHKWSILVLALAGLIAGAFYANRLAPTFTAHGQVEIGLGLVSSATSAQVAASSINPVDEQNLMASRTVAELAKARMGTDESVGDLQARLTVTAIPNSTILGFSFSDPSAEGAQRGGQAFADSYLQLKTMRFTESLANKQPFIKQQIERLQDRLTQVDTELVQLQAGTPNARLLATERATLLSQINTLHAQLQNLKNIAIDVGNVISAPELPRKPNLLKVLAYILFGGGGLLLGLVIGVVIAYIRESASDRLRGAADLEEHLGAPVLGVIPRSKRAKSELIMLAQPDGPEADEYWALSLNFVHAASQVGARKILVTSSTPNEDKSTVAANLAGALAASGERVTLVTADHDRPWMGPALGATDDPAGTLAAVLAGTAQLEDVVQTSKIASLLVVAGGSLHENRGLIASDALEEALRQLVEGSEFLIVDAAPLIVADPLMMIPAIDGVLYVADAKESTRAEAIRARQQVEEVGGQILGAALSGFVPGDSRSESMAPSRKERRLRNRYLTDVLEGTNATTVSDPPIEVK